jgi:hypothetical protein
MKSRDTTRGAGARDWVSLTLILWSLFAVHTNKQLRRSIAYADTVHAPLAAPRRLHAAGCATLGSTARIPLILMLARPALRHLLDRCAVVALSHACLNHALHLALCGIGLARHDP